MQNTAPVSVHLRRANSRAVQDRARWRARYADLVNEIKATKQMRRADPHNRRHEIHLNALRIHAQIMMIDRNMLTLDLQSTAYRYVDVTEETQNGV